MHSTAATGGGAQPHSHSQQVVAQETQLSDLKVAWQFVKMLQSKGVSFLDEISSENLASNRNGSPRAGSLHYQRNGNDVEKGELTGNVDDLDNMSSSADEGRLSLESLDSVDDDTAPLI